MNIENLITLALHALDDLKAKSYVCMSLKDITTCNSYLIIFQGTKDSVTSIKAFKKIINLGKFCPVSFSEINNILGSCSTINIKIADDSNMQRILYDAFHDVSIDDNYM